VNELESELRSLAGAIAFPDAPSLAPAVARRIHRRRRGRRVALALAAAAAALGVAFAVPPARSALLRFFHLEGVTVERVDTLPAARARPFEQSLGKRMPLALAEQRLGFRFLLPPGVRPATVHVLGQMASVLLERDRTPLLLSEFRAAFDELLKKVVGPSTSVEPLSVDGHAGIWVEGATHFLYVQRGGGTAETPLAVSGNVLLWLRGGIVLRLQGSVDRAEALRIAETVGR
jgi:hypothetical protein